MTRIARTHARSHIVALTLIGSLLFAHPAPAQSLGDEWRTFVQALPVGAEIDVRLQDGKRFRATLISAAADRMLIQPRTRVQVPVQPVPYDALSRVALHRDEHRTARAAAIGVAAGAGAVLAVLWILIASSSD